MKCVANMSLGGGFSQALNNALASAVDQGIVFAVAAGNDGGNACTKSPASEPKAITVGSTTRTDTMSDFSNRGSCVDVSAPGSGILSAWTGGTGATNTISGTSMASPRKFRIVACVTVPRALWLISNLSFVSRSADVAGIAASILSTNPSLDPAAVAAKMKADAELLGLDPMGEPIRLTNTVVGGCGGPTVTPTSAPTFALCSANESQITVDIKTDNYPAETTWTLVNSCDASVVLSGGPYTSSITTYSQTTPCLPNNTKYVFTINDSFGDGICCSYGSGEYVVKQDGVQVLSGGQFGSSEVKSFGTCVSHNMT